MTKIVIETSPGKSRVVTSKPYDLEVVLQKNINNLPQLIPLEEAMDEPVELLPIGMEVSAGSGSIDLLLLGSDAVVTIVETKLAKNPESRREVVGQVLEYAAYAADWSLEDVRRIANGYLAGRFDEVLGEFLGSELEDTSGTDEYLGRLAQNLKDGHLRLIVASDRLLETARKTITFVNRNSNFEIYLLQITCYEDEEGTRIYVPSLHGYAQKSKPSPPRSPWTWERYETEYGWSAETRQRIQAALSRMARAVGEEQTEELLHPRWIGLRYQGYQRLGVQLFPKKGLELFFKIPASPLEKLPAEIQVRQESKYLYLGGKIELLNDEQLRVLCKAAISFDK
jgi:hypothetical protein